MKQVLLLILLFVALYPLHAQDQYAVNQKEMERMENETLRKIELDQFDNKIGLDMGLSIVALAEKRNQKIAVQVERLNHSIFLFVDDGLPADKHHWIRRKANVAKHFEESSLSVKYDLQNGNMTLKETFALEKKCIWRKEVLFPSLLRMRVW